MAAKINKIVNPTPRSRLISRLEPFPSFMTPDKGDLDPKNYSAIRPDKPFRNTRSRKPTGTDFIDKETESSFTLPSTSHTTLNPIKTLGKEDHGTEHAHPSTTAALDTASTGDSPLVSLQVSIPLELFREEDWDSDWSVSPPDGPDSVKGKEVCEQNPCSSDFSQEKDKGRDLNILYTENPMLYPDTSPSSIGREKEPPPPS